MGLNRLGLNRLIRDLIKLWTKYSIEDNSLRLYCQQSDSLIQTFLNCCRMKLVSEVVKWFNRENGTSFSLFLIEVVFGKEF